MGAKSAWQSGPLAVERTEQRRVRPRARRVHGWRMLGCMVLVAGASACKNVDLGDNPETPEVSVDESFFHCQIQPNVISAQSCSAGGPGEAGSCHAARSALRLIAVPTPTLCQNDRVVGQPAPESVINFERVRADIGPDSNSSPLYRRPLGLDSHPRVVFTADSPAAMLLRMWLDGQGAP